MAKKLFLLLFSLCTTLISAWFAFVLAETFFFDKLIYKKSPLQGYTKDSWKVVQSKSNLLIENRVRDLLALINQDNTEEKVLGTQTGGEYTISLIGDSTAYGLGVRDNQSFGRVLETKLNKIRPTKVYVLALPGDSIVENYAKFLLVKNRIIPDLYIFLMDINDLIYGHSDKYPNEDKVYEFLRKSCPGPEFIYEWEDENFEGRLINGYVPSYSDKFSNRCWVEVSVKNIVRQSVRFFFFSTFSLEDLDQTAKYGLDSARKSERDIELDYIGLVENNGGVVVNRLDIPVKKEFVSEKENHPSKEVHRLYAETLFQEIITNPQWGF